MAINVNPGDPHYPDGGQSPFEGEVAVRECPSYRAQSKPMTNGDRIRAMSDEELAKFLDDNHNSHGCVCPARDCSATCRQCIEDWLQQPAEEVTGNV